MTVNTPAEAETLDPVTPRVQELVIEAQRRAPLDTYARKSRAAQAYRDLWEELQARLDS